MDEIESLFSHTGDGACTLDKEHRIVSWNMAATAMLGYTREEAIGQIGWQLFAGQTLDGKPFCRPDCPLRLRLQAGKAITSFNLLIRHRSGERILVNVSTIPMPPALNDGKGGLLVHLWRLLDQPITTERLRIYLLGTTAVTRTDGTTVTGAMWNRLKVRALLAYLALRGQQAAHREELIEALWPELDYKSGLHNLNTTVYNLRHSLEPGLKKASDSRYIAHQSGQYFLVDAEHHWLDVRAFEADIRQARLTANPADKIGFYKTAVSLYRGDYLADLNVTVAQSSSEQARYHLLYLAAMEELGEAYEALGQDAEAETWYNRILAIDPCQESAAQRLVRLLTRQRRRIEALLLCQKLAETLEAELNVALSAETSDLLAQIRLPE
jgi:PAS domain S-box-containing protein